MQRQSLIELMKAVETVTNQGFGLAVKLTDLGLDIDAEIVFWGMRRASIVGIDSEREKQVILKFIATEFNMPESALKVTDNRF